MVEIGQVAIIAAFVVTVYSAVVGFSGGILNGMGLVKSARWGFYSILFLLVVILYKSAMTVSFISLFNFFFSFIE